MKAVCEGVCVCVRVLFVCVCDVCVCVLCVCVCVCMYVFTCKPLACLSIYSYTWVHRLSATMVSAGGALNVARAGVPRGRVVSRAQQLAGVAMLAAICAAGCVLLNGREPQRTELRAIGLHHKLVLSLSLSLSLCVCVNSVYICI